jgi:Ca-activated chloride channel family protein
VNGQPQTYKYDDVRFHREAGEEFIARLWATRKIGYLLQQIRLHGEQGELVDEIVDLSIRYGIITPYTSFLVEETERALREEGRQELSYEVRATAAPAPDSGREAVDRSAGEKSLSEAEAPVAVPTMTLGSGAAPVDEYGQIISPVRYVGDKTFILHEGVWTDTLFDSDKMVPVPVSFGGDDYFDLIAARPDWGRYFALGEHVIVVLDGTAYEVREGEAPPLEVPDVENTPIVEPTPPQEPATDGPDNLFEAFIQAILELMGEILDAFSD